MSLPIYNSNQTRLWDQFTIKNEPISSINLMERAATVATNIINFNFDFEEVSIFCGPGNNGGDGLVIARLLALGNKKVHVYTCNLGERSEEFKVNLTRLSKNVKRTELSKQDYQLELETDLIIDCIFGSGLNKPISGWIGEVIDKINSIHSKKIALDIPSGLFGTDNSKTNELKHVFRADTTISLMSPKLAFFFPQYSEYIGKFEIADIGLDENFAEKPLAEYLIESDIQLKKRSLNDYKGTNGCLTLVGGLDNMTGAAIISSMAAMKIGTGYVMSCCSSKAMIPLNTLMPEIIWQDPDKFALNPKTSAIAIGPGLGTSDQALSLLKKVFEKNLPLVIDADALNLLAINKDLIRKIPKNSILTPHIGELRKLIGEFEDDESMLKAQVDFSIKYELYIIQKGAYSKLSTPKGKIFINSTGNPGMATAGMGDALTGIIGGLLAQNYSAEKAACFGMFIHGYSADLLLNHKEGITVLASEVIANLPNALTTLLKSQSHS